MTGGEWLLELVLILLLGATLFHALRLERALGVLKRDRAVLEELVEGFNDSTRQAESGITRLRAAADGAGRQIGRQIEMAQRLRDDLAFLAERGEKLAERLEGAVRAARQAADQGVSSPGASSPGASSLGASSAGASSGSGGAGLARAAPPVVSMASRAAPRGSGGRQEPQFTGVLAALAGEEAAPDPQPRLRSQAERDLMRALRGGR